MDGKIRRQATMCAWLTLLIVSLAGCNGVAQDAGVRSPFSTAHPEVTIPGTQLRTIHSRIVGQDFNIYIQLPPSYGANSTTVYPVFYAMDANRAFPLVANISSVLAFPKENLPEVIVAGIGYPIRDMADWAAWRTRDLTPTSDTGTDNHWNNLLLKMTGRKFDVRSGGAPKFLEFIIKELIPFMESNYRVSDSDRGLGGYSYGGLFVIYTLFTHAETFKRYFAGSPSLEYDSNLMFKYADKSAITAKGLQAKVFLSAGSQEDSTTIANVKEMAEKLQSKYGPSIKVSSRIFDAENHQSCMAVAIMRAFRVLYGP